MKNFEDLIPETFKMDHLLPYFIHIYPKEKSEFLKKIPLFQKHLLILQVFINIILYNKIQINNPFLKTSSKRIVCYIDSLNIFLFICVIYL